MRKKLLSALAAALAFPFLAQAQCTGFYDGFESGVFTTPWTMGSGTYTMTVPNSSPAVGSYNLNMTCTTTNSFYQGPMATFTAGTPNYISWWARTNTTNAANGYFVVGDANTGSNNGVLFSYFNSTSGLRFFASTGYNHPITANTWYHIECYLNWTSRTMDIYVNNALILTAWPFRSTTTTAVDRVYMHSLSAASVDYDDIIIGTPPVTATSTQNNVSCNGGNNGSATVTASGGNGVYTYSWAPSGGSAATASGLTAGTYTCTITDGSGCTGTRTVTITEPGALTASVSSSSVSCNGGNNGAATVTASGGTGAYTYSWAPSGGSAATATGLAMGTYTCTITDANGCSIMQTATITEPAVLQSASAAFGTSCYGSADGSSVVTAMGGTFPYSYSWSPSGGTNATAMGLTAGAYTCTITDANGCSVSETVTITDPPQLLLTVSPPDSICAGSSSVISVSHTGGTGTVSYSWMPGNLSGSTQTVMPAVTTWYFVTATDSNGCSASDSTWVDVIAAPVVSLGSDISQCGGSVTLDAQNSGSLYAWSTGGSSQTETVSSSGTITVMVTNSFGCTASDTINITINSLPVVGLPSEITQCGGSVTLDAQNSGAAYLWSDSSTAQTLTVTSTGVYMVTVTDANGCTAMDTSSVTINTPPVVSGSASATSVCSDDANVSLGGTPAGGTWSGNGVSGSSFDPSVGTGNNVVVYTYTDQNSCTSSDSITIIVNACVGVTEHVAVNGIRLYPNPTSGQLVIETAGMSGAVQMEVMDASGRLVFSSNVFLQTSGDIIRTDLSGLADGMYLMRITNEGSVRLQRVILQR